MKMRTTFGDPDRCMEASEDVEGFVRNDRDCDDLREEVNPLAQEVCSTPYDDDCDMDANDPDAVGAVLWYADADGDGVGGEVDTTTACTIPDGFSESDQDCDDEDPSVFPGAPELCNARDDTCEGEIDEGLTVVRPEDSLQVAINNAMTGDVLCVVGNHVGPITLETNITLSGRGGASATFLTGGSTVLTQTAGIVDGFTIRDGNRSAGRRHLRAGRKRSPAERGDQWEHGAGGQLRRSRSPRRKWCCAFHAKRHRARQYHPGHGPTFRRWRICRRRGRHAQRASGGQSSRDQRGHRDLRRWNHRRWEWSIPETQRTSSSSATAEHSRIRAQADSIGGPG